MKKKNNYLSHKYYKKQPIQYVVTFSHIYLLNEVNVQMLIKKPPRRAVFPKFNKNKILYLYEEVSF